MEEASALTSPSIDLADARQMLKRVHAGECWESVSRLARSDQSSMLRQLPYSSAYEFSDPSCVHVAPENPALETIRLYGSTAYPGFDRVLVDAFQSPEVSATLTALYNRMVHDHSNVALVTNHGDIIDIALVLAALAVAMCDEDRVMGALHESLDVEDFADRANLVVSRMVCTRSAFDIPAIQVLQCLCHTFLSLPQTLSRRRARLDPEYAKANNLAMRAALDDRLAEGGQLLAMAASGSQDLSAAAGLWRKVRSNVRNSALASTRSGARAAARRMRDIPEAPSLHLQPLYSGTIRLMTSCEYALPIATSLDDGHAVCVIGELTRVRDEDDAHGVMEWIAESHEEATGIPTEYHRHEDDMLSNLREALAKRSEQRQSPS